MKRYCLSLAVVGLLCVNALGQTVIVDEDFESYASDADLHTVWAGLAGSFSPGTPEEVEQQFELLELTSDNADFNGNTIVDAADYTVWRNNLGLAGSATQPMGDANGDMNVDQADYDAWKASFGTTPSGGSEGTALRHLKNYINTNPATPPVRVPDGNLVYQPPLDPNFLPDYSIFPSDGLEPIVLRGDIYVDNSVIQRNTIGLRSSFEGTNENLLEMGFYNDPGSQPGIAEAGAAVDGTDAQSRALAGFGVRLQLMFGTPGPNPDWQFFAFDPSWDTSGNGLVSEAEVFDALGGPAWHRFEVTISADPETDGHNFTFTVDLLRDGLNNATGLPGVDGTIVLNDLVTITQAGFNSLRLGGPSSLYSTNEYLFDNIYLSGPLVSAGAAASAAVPEPSSIVAMIVAIGVLSCMWSRRRAA